MFNMSGIEYVCVWVVYACAYLHASTCIIRMCVCVCVCVCVRACESACMFSHTWV